MFDFLNWLNSVVWGNPTLLLILFTGIIISIRTNFFQILYFKNSFKAFFSKGNAKNAKHMSPFQSASTALSATLGTGNIIGVAGAVALGGPGAVFWMWVSALFCMVIKFSEIALSIRYRETNPDGSFSGGAMYYIKNALPKAFTPLAYIFCFCGMVASFGVGNLTQINTMSTCVSSLVNTIFSPSPFQNFLIKLFVGAVCAVCCFFVLKNDGNIGRFCERLFPVMTIAYICMTGFVITANYTKIPWAFSQIIIGAFNPECVTGGVVGSAFVGMRFGFSRGVFSNEAGLGTAPIAYACSDGDEISLGLLGIMEVFIDTVVICTLTALTLLCAGNIGYGTDKASSLVLNALSSSLGKNVIFIFCPVICFFAFSSVIGWGLYGTKFVSFLFGEGKTGIYLTFFILSMLPGAVFRADMVWILAEIFNGLMIIPNITALLFLTNEISDIAFSAKKEKTG